MTEPNPAPEPPDPNVPEETGRTLDPEHHPHPLRSEDVAALIAKEIG
jgi:hypothetical protein